MDEVAVDRAEVAEHGVEVAAGESGSDGLDRRALDLVAAADREREPVPGESVDIRADDDVGGRVVGIRVHRVGTVEQA